MHWSTLLFAISLNVVASSQAASCHSDAPLGTYRTRSGNVLIFREKIVLTKESGESIDCCFMGPSEIKDCDTDEESGELFLILGKPGATRGERLAMFSWAGGKIEKVWTDENRGHNPWKIRLADVDGDSRPEICVGVWKKSRFDPVSRNRLFIYGWDGVRIFPKWLGSRLSSPFIDFDFQDTDGDGFDELVSLEIQRNGLKRVMCYKWSGFGFEGVRVAREDLEENCLRGFDLGEAGGAK